MQISEKKEKKNLSSQAGTSKRDRGDSKGIIFEER